MISRVTEVILRITEVILQVTEVIWRVTEVIFRVTKVILALLKNSKRRNFFGFDEFLKVLIILYYSISVKIVKTIVLRGLQY